MSTADSALHVPSVRRPPDPTRYVVAIASVLAAFAARAVLDRFGGIETPFLLFFGAIMFASWFGGLGPGLVATIGAALLAVFWFVPPRGVLGVPDAGSALRLLLFVGEGAFVAAFSDALREAQRASERGRERFATLVTSSAQLVWSTGPSGAIVEDSPSWRDFTGQTLERWLEPGGWLDVVHPRDRDDVEAAWTRALRLGIPFDHELRVRRADGVYRYMHVRGVPVREADGTIREWIGSTTDVTATKQAAEELARRARRLEVLHTLDRAVLRGDSREAIAAIAAEHVGQALRYRYVEIAALDGTGTEATIIAVRAPPGVRALVGARFHVAPWPPHERTLAVLDLATTGSFHPYARALCAAGVRALVGVPLRRDLETYGALLVGIASADPTEVPAELLVEIATQLAVAFEQTLLRERLRAHAEELEHVVARRTEQLQRANDALTAFARTVAHDLRAPLRAMHGFGTALLEDYGAALDERGKGYASRLVGSAERMDELIRDLLAYSRLSRADMSLGVIDLDGVVTDAQETVAGEYPEVRHARIERPLGAVRGHLPTMLLIVQNLLANAAKFVRAGEAPVIRVHSERRPDGRVRLWVEDEGIGIAPEHHRRIFDVYERLHSEEEYPGTGVGLATVARGAERMGGTAGVESAPGKGSRFFVELEAA